MPQYRLDENNSGGSFWLDRKDYEALFADGWFIDEDKAMGYQGSFSEDFLKEKDVPWAWRHSLCVEADSMQEAVERFESVTGQDFFAVGCHCCGAPFSMSGPNNEWLDGWDTIKSRPF